jgi:hypothetical protein
MLDLILIIMLIISLSKPDILLNKKMKEGASDEQKIILTRNFRKIFGIGIAIFETGALSRYLSGGWSILILAMIVVELILFFKYVVPAIKENKKINNEIKNNFEGVTR